MPEETPNLSNPVRIERPLSTGGGERKQQLFGLELVISLMRSLVGSDERPSPFIRTLSEGTQQQAAATELAQDGVILGIKILRLVKNAATGKIRSVQIISRIISIVIEAIPELREDVELIEAARKLDK